MRDESLHRLEALADAATRLASSTTSGRITLERVRHGLDPALVPPERIQALDDLLERAAPGPPALKPDELLRTLEEEWDADPGDELQELDEHPAAVTPTAQVHRGVLDGRPVAIKVLRADLAARYRQDLTLLEALAGPLRAAFPAIDPAGLIAEVRERVLDELDLEHEAVAQRRFHRALRHHPRLYVPPPVMRLCTERALVSEWVDGTPLLEASDRDTAAARLVTFVLGAARLGMMHADPDPDDALVMADGRLAILDFGAVCEVERVRADVMADAIDASLARDAARLGEAMEALELMPAGEGPALLELLIEGLGPLLSKQEVRLEAELLRERGRRMSAHRPGELARLLQMTTLAPQDLWPARAFGQVFAAAARAEANGRWAVIARDALRHGWEAAR